MKRLVTLALVLVVLLGQAPAWAMVGSCLRPMGSGLACVRICAKSADLLTQHGKLPSLGQVCARVQTRFAQPGVVALNAPDLGLPILGYALPSAAIAGRKPTFAMIHRAHAPPGALPAQAVLSVPVAQAPPSRA